MRKNIGKNIIYEILFALEAFERVIDSFLREMAFKRVREANSLYEEFGII